MNFFYNPVEKRLHFIWRICLLLISISVAANFFVKPFVKVVPSVFESAVLNTSMLILFLVILYASSKWIEKRPFGAYGLRMNVYEFLAGVSVGCIMLTCIFLIQYKSGWLVEKQYSGNELQNSFIVLFIAQILRYTAGSILEELFSRGYLLINFTEAFNFKRLGFKGSVYLSIIITALLFGVLHLFNEHATFLGVLNISLFGLVLGLAVLYTGKLFFSIGMHAAWNITQNNIFGLNNSGKTTEVSIFTYTTTGPEIFTGGSFGPEGSIVSTVILSVAVLVLFFLCKKRMKLNKLNFSYYAV